VMVGGRGLEPPTNAL